MSKVVLADISETGRGENSGQTELRYKNSGGKCNNDLSNITNLSMKGEFKLIM